MEVFFLLSHLLHVMNHRGTKSVQNLTNAISKVKLQALGSNDLTQTQKDYILRCLVSLNALVLDLESRSSDDRISLELYNRLKKLVTQFELLIYNRGDLTDKNNTSFSSIESNDGVYRQPTVQNNRSSLPAIITPTKAAPNFSRSNFSRSSSFSKDYDTSFMSFNTPGLARKPTRFTINEAFRFSPPKHDNLSNVFLD